MRLSEEMKELFIENLGDFGEVQAYSGRGMYGKKCVAAVTDSNPFEVVTAILAEVDDYDDRIALAEIMSNTKTDNMGLSTVIYWPDVEMGDEDGD